VVPADPIPPEREVRCGFEGSESELLEERCGIEYIFCSIASDTVSESVLRGSGGGGLPGEDEQTDDEEIDLSELYELCFRGGKAGPF
jgi:hypothetical protein